MTGRTRRWIAFVIRWALWAIGGVALMLVAAFVELSEEVAETGPVEARLVRADTVVLRLVARARRPWLNAIAMDLTALGSPVVVTLFTIVVVAVLIVKSDRRGAAMLAVSAVVSALLTVALKALLERPRPAVVPRLVEVSGLSYPSGHSLASAAVYLTAAIILARHLAVWSQRASAIVFAATLVLLVGGSRVYLGVHFPSDVLGGMLLGTACALVTGAVLRSLDRTREKASEAGVA